ncbi:MAG: hypothetical protein KME49_10810 [Brasilonema octagenarum HA4186-MV1]|jgi:hypothetical protein|uniref:C-type lysozyme inhibitor domain-containing protein n=1 Tax=Brasilonema octagenarum UFV-OR1 TaxID=417115 RepID=A0ABX1MBI2_9CYAN|nr:hypothetical protein [Brasilonema octagenarum]MBW4625969.1 hypothetical protein [Brasilonema octagenarum HA4186-MV1]NMF64304.1 hypothetical protein [Brasilonema octagenarum UFV-OR1]
MKLLPKQSTVLLGLMTCVLAHLPSLASADSTADLLLSLNCQSDYTVNVWRRYASGELLYRATGPLGNLSLGKGTKENTGAAEVYKFRNGNYVYQVLGGRGDHRQQGTLAVFKNGRSFLNQACRPEG